MEHSDIKTKLIEKIKHYFRNAAWPPQHRVIGSKTTVVCPFIQSHDFEQKKSSANVSFWIMHFHMA